MGDHARTVAILITAVAYGALLLAGGLCWYVGWKRRNESILKAGDVTVLTGLVADAVLVTGNWLFNWSGWLEAMIH